MQAIVRVVPAGTKQIVVAPLGDIQWAGRPGQIALTHLKDHIARALDQDAWFVGMGDYLDTFSPSNRRRVKAAELYDTAELVIEDKTLDLVTELYETVLKPTTGRWLCLLEGHHYATLSTGETTDHVLCRLLKAPFGGTCAYCVLNFSTNHGTRHLTLWAHHGFGGGSKAHAPLLKLENLLPYWDADIFLMGHMTKVAVAPVKRLYAAISARQPVTIKERTIHLVGTGGWLKGYQQDAMVGRHPRGNYVEVKGLNPVALGAPLITITPRMQWDEGTRPGRAKNKGRTWAPIVRVEV